MVQELENRTILLKKEMENNMRIIQKLECENSSLRKENADLLKTLEDTRIK